MHCSGQGGHSTSSITVSQINGEIFVNGQKLEGLDTSQPLTIVSINGTTTVNGQPVPPADTGGQAGGHDQTANEAAAANTAGAESINPDALPVLLDMPELPQVLHLDNIGQGDATDWNALAAIVQANFAHTGCWFL